MGHPGSIGAVFLILLAFVIAFTLVARRIQVPYPVVLVIAGLALSLVPRTPQTRPDLQAVRLR